MELMFRLSLKWDFLNKSLYVDESGRSGDQELNSWGSYFKLPKTLDGPFSKKRVMHENEELTLVGNRQEMMEFQRKCMTDTELAISVNLPHVKLILPGKEFYELLYNRYYTLPTVI